MIMIIHINFLEKMSTYLYSFHSKYFFRPARNFRISLGIRELFPFTRAIKFTNWFNFMVNKNTRNKNRMTAGESSIFPSFFGIDTFWVLHKILFYLLRFLPYANAFSSHRKIEILLCAERDKHFEEFTSLRLASLKI